MPKLISLNTFKTINPQPLDRNTQEVFQMINSGAKYRNIENFPNFRLGHELPGIGPASLPGKAILSGPSENVKFIMQDTAHPATMAHEMGHMLAGHGTGGAGEIFLNRAPIVSDIYLPFREFQANHNGAKLLKKIYADNPEMVSRINRDMYLNNLDALGTYASHSVGNLAGTAIGGIAGDRVYKERAKKYNKNVDDIKNNKFLSDEEKKKRIKQLGYSPNKWAYRLGGGALGWAGTKTLFALPQHVMFDRAIKPMLNTGLSQKDKEFVDMMRAHAKKHGYDKNVIKDMNPQGWGDPSRAVEFQVIHPNDRPAVLRDAYKNTYETYANRFVD